MPPEAMGCAPPCPLHYLGISLLSEFSPHTVKVLSPLWVGRVPQANTSLLEQGRCCSTQEGAHPEPHLSVLHPTHTDVCVHVGECVWGVHVS